VLNYITAYMVSGTETNDPGGGTRTLVVGTEEELADALAVLEGDPNGPFLLEFYGKVFILLNKQNVMALAGQAWANQLTVPGSNPYDLLQNVANPKKTWNSTSVGFSSLAPESATGSGVVFNKKASGTKTIRLITYLNLLLNTWQSGIGVQVPKRWIDWLTLLISHFSRYTETQIHQFLLRVDFSAKTFKV
jgi:hypothetical protein